MSQKGFYRSGELAELFGISSDTLRYYEQMGVLPVPRRSANRYREYPAEAMRRIELIRSALLIGFTMKELSEILRDRERGGAPCEHVRQLAQEKIKEIEQQLKSLKRMRKVLQFIASEWDQRLEASGNGRRAYLLETLSKTLAQHKKGDRK